MSLPTTPDEAAPTALVTGASSGIGAAFARRLAADGYQLVLVARDGERLAAVRASLLAGGSPPVEILAVDLTDTDQRDQVTARLADPQRPVELLVNCAGIGLGRSFTEVSTDDLDRQLALNVTAVMMTTKAVLPGMTARGHGAVVNVASVAGLFPNPGASYAGTKAWVVAFTEGLAITLRGTGVRVQALCPGLTRTEFHQRAGIALGRTPGFSFVSAEKVVDTALADLRRGRVVSVPGLLYKATVLVTKFLPRRANRALAARIYAVRDD